MDDQLTSLRSPNVASRESAQALALNEARAQSAVQQRIAAAVDANEAAEEDDEDESDTDTEETSESSSSTLRPRALMQKLTLGGWILFGIKWLVRQMSGQRIDL